MEIIENWDCVRILGRTPVSEDGLKLIWSGSGAEFIFRGTELGIDITGGTSLYQPWISLIMDGAWLMHMPVQEGLNRFIFLKGLDNTIEHNIRIVKDTQAMPDDEDSFVILNSLVYDGQIKKTKDYKYRIEFIGDSITSGEGMLGAHDSMDWISPYFGVAQHYGVLVCSKLSAEYRLISQSGWGIVNAWDNNTTCTLPLVYESLGCERGIADYDFESWRADVVIINLGTNDEGSFHNQGYTDPLTGNVHKMRLNEDGSYNADDIKVIQKGVVDFLKTLRQDNPKAYLVWVYGMLGDGLGRFIKAAVDEYVIKTEDKKASYLPLPDTKDDGFGSRQHPGPKSHQKSAEVIVNYLKELL